jgi:hypothetical protein
MMLSFQKSPRFSELHYSISDKTETAFNIYDVFNILGGFLKCKAQASFFLLTTPK